MEINFGWLNFEVEDNSVRLNGLPFIELQIAGENKDSHFGSKMICSSEGNRLKYRSHEQVGDTLIITQQSDLVRVKTYFRKYQNTNAVSVYSEAVNVSDQDVIIEYFSSFVYSCPDWDIRNTNDVFLYKFTQSHHEECQPRKYSLFDLGLFDANPVSQKRIGGANIGSWSTKEALPQGIIEYKNDFLMFQIESNNSWYYEISDNGKKLYLYLGGATEEFGGCVKKLKKGDSMKTVNVCLSLSDSVGGVVAEMTKYRREICPHLALDKDLPTIFNEYMHLSWDSPTEENTKRIAPTVAKLGVKYYVIDCGWHNEEDGNVVYPYVGQWRESKKRFPSGVRKTTDYLRSLGLKAGLWIEPEIVGCKCQEMLDYYDDDCFISRYGKRVCVMGRYFLDYRNQKVVDYMTKTIRRMVEDYGADYIKMDYNQDLGIGTDKDSDSFGEGLEQCAKAYLLWIETIQKKFPNTLFEICSSGGMRMDYETLKHFSIVSTSDQTDYTKYPFIAGNILSAVLPEQAAVWSYPVDTKQPIGTVYTPTETWVEENIKDEQIAMNMVNSFLGRMHLASHVELLSERKQQLVKDGIACYDYLTPIKKQALPYFPLGFTDFNGKYVVAGLKTATKIVLAVWNLQNSQPFSVPLYGDFSVKGMKILYPNWCDGEFSLKDNVLLVNPLVPNCARLVEISIG